MRLGLRNGLGIMKSTLGNVNIKSFWEDDKPIGAVIIERPLVFTIICEFN